MTCRLRGFFRRLGTFLLTGVLLCSICCGWSALPVSASEADADGLLPDGDPTPSFLILDRTTYLLEEPVTGIFCFGIGSLVNGIPNSSYSYYSTYQQQNDRAKLLGCYYHLFASGPSTPASPERSETEWVEQYIALNEQFRSEGSPISFDGSYLLSSREMTRDEMIEQFWIDSWNQTGARLTGSDPSETRENFVKFRYCERVVIPRELFSATEGTITLRGRLQSFFMNDTLHHLSIYPELMPEEYAYVAEREDLNEKFRNENGPYMQDPYISISYRLQETEGGTAIVFDSQASGSPSLIHAVVYYTPLPLSHDTKKGGDAS